MDNSKQRKSTRPPAAVGMRFVKAPTFNFCYANNAQVTVSNWDFSITFGEGIGTDESGAAMIEQRVRVSMSPQHMKALVHILRNNLESYERMFGEVRWEPVNVQAQGEKEQT